MKHDLAERNEIPLFEASYGFAISRFKYHKVQPSTQKARDPGKQVWPAIRSRSVFFAPRSSTRQTGFPHPEISPIADTGLLGLALSLPRVVDQSSCYHWQTRPFYGG
jgi:hypothetical protein